MTPEAIAAIVAQVVSALKGGGAPKRARHIKFAATPIVAAPKTTKGRGAPSPKRKPRTSAEKGLDTKRRNAAKAAKAVAIAPVPVSRDTRIKRTYSMKTYAGSNKAVKKFNFTQLSPTAQKFWAEEEAETAADTVGVDTIAELRKKEAETAARVAKEAQPAAAKKPTGSNLGMSRGYAVSIDMSAKPSASPEEPETAPASGSDAGASTTETAPASGSDAGASTTETAPASGKKAKKPETASAEGKKAKKPKTTEAAPASSSDAEPPVKTKKPKATEAAPASSSDAEPPAKAKKPRGALTDAQKSARNDKSKEKKRVAKEEKLANEAANKKFEENMPGQRFQDSPEDISAAIAASAKAAAAAEAKAPAEAKAAAEAEESIDIGGLEFE